MLTSVYAHVFLTAAGFKPDRLPPIDDSIPDPWEQRIRQNKGKKKTTSALRETREQFRAPTSSSC